jgi:hypothetical protein
MSVFDDFLSGNWPGRYILDDNGEPVPCPNLMEWAMWMEKGDRIVLQTQMGESRVSTVFLGLDHSFGRAGPPTLFETMIFGGPCNEECWRYATRLEALEGHAAAMQQVEQAMKERQHEER